MNVRTPKPLTRSNRVAESIVKIAEIPLKEIRLVKDFNSRQHYEPNPGAEVKDDTEQAAVGRLAESIKHEGLIQPLTVRPRADGKGYDLVIGFRRYAALKALGVETARCEIFEGDEKAAMLRNLAENVQRKDLTTYDLACRCQLLKSEKFGLTGGDIARVLGKDRTYVNVLVQRLEILPDYILRAWADPANPRHGQCDTMTLNKLTHLAKDPAAVLAAWNELCGITAETGQTGASSGGTASSETAATPPTPPVKRPTSVKIAEAITALEANTKVHKAYAAAAIAALRWAGAIGGARAPKTLRINGELIYPLKPASDAGAGE